MTIALTGASGLLGHRVVEMLLDAACSVRVVSRPSSQFRTFDAVTQPQIVRCDLFDVDALADVLKDCGTIVHCAGHVQDWGPLAAFQRGNTELTRSVVTAAKRCMPPPRLIHVSSTDVYGYPLEPCDETGPLVDVGLPYNSTKIECERLVSGSGLPIAIVRPATIFGPHAKDWGLELRKLLRVRIVATFERGLTPAGMTYVDDVAHAIVALTRTPEATGAFNVTDPKPTNWRDFFDCMADATGLPRPFLNFNLGIAAPLASASEVLFGNVAPKARPPLTHHLLRLMTRSQHFPSNRILTVDPAFPIVGVSAGLARTAAWLRGSP